MLIDSSVFDVLDRAGCLTLPPRPRVNERTRWLPTSSGAMLHRIDRHPDRHFFDSDGMCASLCGGVGRPTRIGALVPLPLGRKRDGGSRSALDNDQAIWSICTTWNYVAVCLERAVTARQQRESWIDDVDRTLAWYHDVAVGRSCMPSEDTVAVGWIGDAWRAVPTDDRCWLPGWLTAAGNAIVNRCTSCQRLTTG